jgi:diamine N-acetyltransferase
VCLSKPNFSSVDLHLEQRFLAVIIYTGVAMVCLEPLTLEHLPHVMTWVNDKTVMQYFATRQETISEEEELGYLKTLVASPNDRAFSIFEDGEGGQRYVGQCSINQIYWPARNGRLFIAITRSGQHKGHGPRAVRQLLNLAWTTLDLHKVWLIVRRDNLLAQAMYLKLGFEFEGVLRDEYHVGGRYYDMVRMGIVRPQS